MAIGVLAESMDSDTPSTYLKRGIPLYVDRGVYVNSRLMILAFGAALIFVAPLQAQQTDYSKDRYYSLGNRDGYHDFKKMKHKNHKHKFPSGDDRQAYDQGYEVGRLGGRTYHVDRVQSSWSRVRTSPSTID
jgi:hypothetical protein